MKHQQNVLDPFRERALSCSAVSPGCLEKRIALYAASITASPTTESTSLSVCDDPVSPDGRSEVSVKTWSAKSVGRSGSRGKEGLGAVSSAMRMSSDRLGVGEDVDSRGFI